MESAILEGAFAAPVFDSQAAFRAILAALAEPGTAHRLPASAPPAPLSPTAGSIALSLCDQETPVAIDPAFRAAAPWITFHTGAPVTDDRTAARFAFLSGLDTIPPGFGVGDDLYPDRSATLVAPIRLEGRRMTLRGPGIDGTRTIAASFTDAFLDGWAANRALFPRGLDLILVDEIGGAVLALPRTTEVTCTSR
ncbi:phosphonate C-P lyase system protein PhnH [Acuticoccus sediminis]|uniref:phosphonate C-P lyase system protein PhnH n=1 Tax=Acuticoccus sediminis TaxID=2184697 RepID=UPI001CFEF25F|nr:phosphonate C-P lyase system protein PhnH [Acuticoccus sediminis]